MALFFVSQIQNGNSDITSTDILIPAYSYAFNLNCLCNAHGLCVVVKRDNELEVILISCIHEVIIHYVIQWPHYTWVSNSNRLYKFTLILLFPKK